MKDSSPDHHQMSFMAAGLMDQLNPNHPLLQLARTIPWDFFESEFAPLYAPIGRPAKPILAGQDAGRAPCVDDMDATAQASI
jgi:IS5 family transposase